MGKVKAIHIEIDPKEHFRYVNGTVLVECDGWNTIAWFHEIDCVLNGG